MSAQIRFWQLVIIENLELTAVSGNYDLRSFLPFFSDAESVENLESTSVSGNYDVRSA